MAPVQTFGSSPITAAKSPTATATAKPDQSNQTVPASRTATQSLTSTSRYGPPPAAQPGSRPSNPTASATLSSSGTYPQPTPTRPTQDTGSPPAPQPGAVPRPPGAASPPSAATATNAMLPPPPKNGEKLGPQHTGEMPAATAPLVAAPEGGYPLPTMMPAQMAYPPPETSHSLRGTSSTATAGQPLPYAALGPVQLPVGGIGGTINQATDMSHPPGYQQDVHATEFSSGQRAAHNAYVSGHNSYPGFSSSGGLGGGGYDGSSNDDESLWNTAKKWASAAGNTLAAAESEVWKAVNKDQK